MKITLATIISNATLFPMFSQSINQKGFQEWHHPATLSRHNDSVFMESLGFEPPAHRQDQSQWCALVLKMVFLGTVREQKGGPIVMNRNRNSGAFDESLVVLLDQLRHELTALRMTLDDIRDQVEEANQNRDDDASMPNHCRRITSMPLDPCAPDWSERLNQFSAADVDASVNPPTPKPQGELF
jgi:hypothetical protein